jgi:nitrogen fixation NifU-like protein
MKNELTKEQLEQNPEIARVSAEVLEHMMNPKNYGKMEDSNGIGMGIDQKTGEFAMVYIKVDDEILSNITFGCNACQDTVVAGSLFTEMVKGDTLENAITALKLMSEKILTAPKRQQACSNMVLTAFRAAIINRDNKMAGMDEEMFTIDMQESCEGINLNESH